MRQQPLSRDGSGLALGCSGGPDSLALALLLKDWCEAEGRKLTALVVNHGIRAEAGAEAAAVAKQLSGQGIEAIILEGDWEDGAGDIQNRARALRYRLMLDWCRGQGRKDLFLAHHAEDQAETLLLRLGRGSGVDGLAAMRHHNSQWGDVTLHRPLLDIPKACLLATVTRAGLEPVLDPSNTDLRFARVRMRGLMPELAAEGFTPERLGATARRMARASDALDHYTQALLDEAARLYTEGYCRLDPAPLRQAPVEIALRALSRLLRAVTGSPYPAREEKVENLLKRLISEDLGGGVTVAGCKVVQKRGMIFICRELAAMPQSLEVATEVVWDSRFLLTCTDAAEELEYRPLGAEGWASYKRRQVDYTAGELPAAVYQSLPSVWRASELILVPHLPALPDGGKCPNVEVSLLTAGFFGLPAFSSPLRHTI